MGTVDLVVKKNKNKRNEQAVEIAIAEEIATQKDLNGATYFLIFGCLQR